jgi:hypothetical protein
MTFALLLMALAVSGAGVWASRRWRAFGQTLMAIGGLSLLGVVALQVRQNLFPPQPKMPGRCEIAVSVCLANQMLRDLPGRSGNVFLLFPQRQFIDADTEQSYEQGFTLPLRHGHGQLHLTALRVEGKKGKDGYDVSAFKQALAQAQDALAIISYVGVPIGCETLFSEQPRPAPWYVLDPEGTTHWLAALKAGHIRAVVLPRPGVAPHDREVAAGRPDAIFERFYLLATPQNADQVASQIESPSHPQ